MKIIDRYLQAAILQATAVVALAVAALVFVITLIGEAGDIGKGDYGLLRVLEYLLLRLPDDLYLVFPVVALLGALLGLGGLAAGSELVVVRAAGVSVARLAGSALAAGLVLALAGVMLGEILGPWGVQLGEDLRDRAKYGRQVQTVGEGLWLRSGQDYVRIDGTLRKDVLVGINIYRKANGGGLSRIAFAERAVFSDGAWQLRDVTMSAFGGAGVATDRRDTLNWDVNIEPRLLRLSVIQPEELSTWGLYRYINYLDRNEVAAGDYRLAFWRNLVSPFTVMVLTVLALPFSLGSLRTAGAGQRLFAGGFAGAVFFIINEIVAAGGQVYGAPAWLAAALPTVLLAVGVVVWIRRLN